MKSFLLITVIILCFLSLSSIKITEKQIFLNTIELDLTIDSGYILKPEGVKLLLDINETKLKFNSWKNAEDSDTLGKYYFSSKSGNYILCVSDYSQQFDFETHILIELKRTKKNNFKVIAKERYFHGNYSCCWNNRFDGFQMDSNWFSFKECGTGSGFCSSRKHYFRKVIPQKNSTTLLEEMSFCDSELYDSKHCLSISSKEIISENYITFNYVFEDLEFNDGSEIEKSIKKDLFTVIYELKNGKWTANDSTKLKEYSFF